MTEPVFISPAAALVIIGLFFMMLEAFVSSLGASAIGGTVVLTLGAASMYQMEFMPAFILNWEFVEAAALCCLILTGLAVFMAARIHNKKPVTGPEAMIGANRRLVTGVPRSPASRAAARQPEYMEPPVV